MKVIRYSATWFEVGLSSQSEAKFVAGEFYPVTDESKSHIAQGIAEEIDAPEDAEKADEKADKLAAKATDAADAADAAKAAAEAASAAKTLAKSA